MYGPRRLFSRSRVALNLLFGFAWKVNRVTVEMMSSSLKNWLRSSNSQPGSGVQAPQ